MKTFSQIDTSNITSAQISTAFKFFIGSVAYYKVASQTTDGVEYTVGWTASQGFSCTCAAGGDRGFSGCKRYGVCSHVRIAVATEKEVRQALAELEAAATTANNNSNIFEKINARDGKITAALAEEAATVPALTVDGVPADVATLARVFIDARPARTTRAKAQSPKAFSILK